MQGFERRQVLNPVSCNATICWGTGAEFVVDGELLAYMVQGQPAERGLMFWYLLDPILWRQPSACMGDFQLGWKGYLRWQGGWHAKIAAAQWGVLGLRGRRQVSRLHFGPPQTPGVASPNCTESRLAIYLRQAIWRLDSPAITVKLKLVPII